MKELTETQLALYYWARWSGKGKPLTKQNMPHLNKIEVVAIVRVLLPRVAPDKKVGDYINKGPCMNWMMSLAGGTTWETEMEAVDKEHNAKH